MKLVKDAGVVAAALAVTVFTGGLAATAASADPGHGPGDRDDARPAATATPSPTSTPVQTVSSTPSATATATPTATRRVQQSGMIVKAITLTGATPTVTVVSDRRAETVWSLTSRTKFDGAVRKAADLKVGLRINLGGTRVGTGLVADHVVTPNSKGNKAVLAKAKADKARADKAKADKAKADKAKADKARAEAEKHGRK